ncbi:hypothetical protein [Paraburkholderia bryophila]|uniref:O-antigen ligase-like membrane protein n=1 Tax=Paraburkholderia bryophila TaxID=420952 RepID=A0A7Z0AZF2_9BURK|nr:hypothetical protein [Paraburkholderia bryophila]NYH14495.1 hypothetical protein [Paraburkholderia bryophila]
MYARLISVLFYMLFTCVVLNPQVGGFTIYLYIFVPFLDPDFSRFIAGTARKWSTPLFVALVASAIGSPSMAMRVASLAICVGYLMYTYERRIAYLQPWIAFNVVFAIVQFTMYYVDRPLSYQLGPTAIAKMVWGPYATLTYTNFFEVFYFSRVSGLSREAGFFSSLLVSSFIIYLYTEKPSKKMIAIYFIGFFISFSKSTAVLFIATLLYPFRHNLKRIHPLVVLVLFSAAMCIFSLYLAAHDFFESDTFGHRFSGYAFLFDAQIDDLIKGIDQHEIVRRYGNLQYIKLVRTDIETSGFAGLANNVAEMGLFPAIIVLVVIAISVNDGFSMLILLFLTSTLALLSVTSFISLAYLIAYWPRFSPYSRDRIAKSRAQSAAITLDLWRSRPKHSARYLAATKQPQKR